MATMTTVKRWALGRIDEHANRFSDFHVRIWNYAEPAWREYKSAKTYCDLLRAEGFAVEEGSGGMPTAFCARWVCACAPPAAPLCSQQRAPRRWLIGPLEGSGLPAPWFAAP